MRAQLSHGNCLYSKDKRSLFILDEQQSLCRPKAQDLQVPCRRASMLGYPRLFFESHVARLSTPNRNLFSKAQTTYKGAFASSINGKVVKHSLAWSNQVFFIAQTKQKIKSCPPSAALYNRTSKTNSLVRSLVQRQSSFLRFIDREPHYKRSWFLEAHARGLRLTNQSSFIASPNASCSTPLRSAESEAFSDPSLPGLAEKPGLCLMPAVAPMLCRLSLCVFSNAGVFFFFM